MKPPAETAVLPRDEEGWTQKVTHRIRNAFQSPPESSAIWPMALSALFIALTCMPIPTAAPDLGADSSWCGVLNWAHVHGLQFGTQIVFTYGPLGYLFAPYCLEPPSNFLIFINAALVLQVTMGLCLVAWRLAPAWRFMLLVFFVLESTNAEARADLLMCTGFLCWGLSSAITSGARQKVSAINFVALAGFAAFTKVNFLFLAFFSVSALSVYFGVGRQPRMLWTFLAGFLAAITTIWVACGQNLGHLGSFIRNAFFVSRDYDQAATLEGLPSLRFWTVLIALVVLAAMALRAYSLFISSPSSERTKTAVLLVWLIGLLFMVWKRSMVRTDRFHFFDLAVLGPLVPLTLEAIPCSASMARAGARAIGLASCLLALYSIESAFLPGLVSSVQQVFSQAADNATWLLRPNESRKNMQRDLSPRQQEADLPRIRQLVGNATVDVFGFHQAHALLNKLHYHPRPVFQSYVAYNAELARLNQDFYLGAEAPQYVLFELANPEHRFPALDDSWALRTILENYMMVGAEQGFLLLQQRISSRTNFTLLEKGEFRLGDRLDVNRYAGTNLWLELHLKPNWKGRLLKFFYRPRVLRVSVWTNSIDGLRNMARRQAAPSTLASGFQASPFFVNTSDISRLFHNQAAARPSAFSLATTPEYFWESTVHFKLYGIENDSANKSTR